MKKFILIAFCFLIAAQPVFSQSSFDKKKAEAKAAANRGDYVLAVRIIEQVRNLPSLTDAQEKEIQNLSKEYRRERDRLELSVMDLSFSPTESSDSVDIRAGQPTRLDYSIARSDSWIKAGIDKGKRKLFISVDSNPEKKERTGKVTITMGGIKTQLTVSQARRPDVSRYIRVAASPAYSTATVENKRHGLPYVFSLNGGRKYVFHIEKKDYHPLDTAIFIPDDESAANDTIDLNANLVPEFALVRVNWTIPEDCAVDTSKIKLQINRVPIDNFVTGDLRIYDSDARVKHYSLYEDGTIPVSSGSYIDVSLEAPGYKTAEFKGPELRDGEIKDVNIDLVPLMGQLSITGDYYFPGSAILIDGREIGTVGEDGNTFSVQTGKHVLTVQKPGFRTYPESSYDIEILQDQLTSLDIQMVRDVRVVFDSNPAGATVIFDGKELPYKTPTPAIPIDPVIHELTIKKDGYMDVQQSLTEYFTYSHSDTLVFNLLPSKTIHITADQENVYMDILGDYNNSQDSVFFKDIPLPADLNLYPRKTPYRVRLYEHKPDGSRKKIYWHDHLYFKPNGSTRKDYTIWPCDHFSFQFIGGDYFISAPTIKDIPVGESTGDKFSLRPTFSAYFAKLGFNKVGLSWSALKATHFMFNGSVPTQFDSFLNGIPAITFIDLEWRGGISFWKKWVQVNALVSYAYYPNLQNFFNNSIMRLPISCISGHEFFIGGEITIAPKQIPINIKAGWQMYKGLTANLSMYGANVQTVPLEYPGAFVFSVGINIGQFGRGNPALRFGTF